VSGWNHSSGGGTIEPVALLVATEDAEHGGGLGKGHISRRTGRWGKIIRGEENGLRTPRIFATVSKLLETTADLFRRTSLPGFVTNVVGDEAVSPREATEY
jgi:hypothetical protein